MSHTLFIHSSVDGHFGCFHALGYMCLFELRFSLSMCPGFPGGASSKVPACQGRRHKRYGFDLWVRKIPSKKEWQPTPIFLPGESHEKRNLACYSPWGCRAGHDPSDLVHMHCLIAIYLIELSCFIPLFYLPGSQKNVNYLWERVALRICVVIALSQVG